MSDVERSTEVKDFARRGTQALLPPPELDVALEAATWGLSTIGLYNGISETQHEDRYVAAAEAIMGQGDVAWSGSTKKVVTDFYNQFIAATVRFISTATGVVTDGCTTKDTIIARLVAEKVIPVTWNALDAY